MLNQALVSLVNSVLGTGKQTSKGNYAYTCPFCNHHKPKLEINLEVNEEGLNPYHCWVCNKKGKKLITLFKAVSAPLSKIEELKRYVLISYQDEHKTPLETLALPKEFIPLSDLGNKSVYARQALAYLKKRNITDLDIKRYNIGYCETGKLNSMIVIPSYDKLGVLNYYVARNFGPGDFKYKNPKVSKNIIPLELQINWNSPVVLCEGMFDAIAIKRNAIPLLGKTISEQLMKKIVSAEVKQVFIALDKDALKQALEHCQTLLNHGKEVFLIDLQQKDPSELGFEQFTRLLHTSQPLTLRKLLEKKFEL